MVWLNIGVEAGEGECYSVQIDTFVYLTMVREVLMRGAFLSFDNVSTFIYLNATVNEIWRA